MSFFSEDMVDEIDSGKDDNSEDDKTAERQAKFLLYWMTTTLTSTSTTTSTSFSSTQTLTLTVCTPTTVVATCKLILNYQENYPQIIISRWLSQTGL